MNDHAVTALVLLVSRTAMRMGEIPFVGATETPRVILDVARDLVAADGLARVNVDRLVQAVERHVVRGQAEVLVEAVVGSLAGLDAVTSDTRLDGIGIACQTDQQARIDRFTRETLGPDAPLVEIGAARTVAEETDRIEAALIARLDGWYGERAAEEAAHFDPQQLAEADADAARIAA